MYDIIEKIGNSLLQHGKYNDRIYLMKADSSDFPQILLKLDKLADEQKYSKIFAKVPAALSDVFLINGYVREAKIPGFFNGKEDAVFFSRFTDPARKNIAAGKKQKIQQNLALAKNRAGAGLKKKLADTFLLRKLAKTDLKQLASLYRQVFDSYPFPIFETDYLKKTMDNNVYYFGIFQNDILVAASSAEVDAENSNSEMTDFATLPDFRSNNFSLLLLNEMEKEMQMTGIKTLYTIARSYSAGMNITFSKMDYGFSGTLVNNTNIAGSLECMNVWYKTLL